MDKLKLNWFSELNPLWPGQCMSLEVEEVLFNEKSDYQDVLVFKSKSYGNVLVLDGVIQCTERDEFSYQEMIVNLPLFSHPNPKKVLIIGGGDGGALREVLKHPCVEEVTICEIDKVVIEVSKKFLPSMAKSFSHPKVKKIVGDGIKFMKEYENYYDVIITDSSDPQGPAKEIFEKPYYEKMKRALSRDGIICCQGECLWLHLNIICEMKSFCEQLFPVVNYAYCTIPTYPSGQIGFLLCGKNPEQDFKTAVRRVSEEELDEMNLNYYNYEVHQASFVLPQFAAKALKKNHAEPSPYLVCEEVEDDN